MYFTGQALLEETRRVPSRTPRELSAFVGAMDATGPWSPVPVTMAASPPGGPVEHAFFETVLVEIEQALDRAAELDGVYVVNHGAMLTTEIADPDGELVRRIRERVGPDVPIIMTLDLHANVSEQMVSNVDCIVGYRTNPHVDQVQRGEEAAFILRQLMAGTYVAHSALVRLPLTPPTVTLLTSEGPYAEAIAYGQRRLAELGGGIVNVSVFGGFVFSDSPKTGLSVVVTARDDRLAAESLANEIGDFVWSRHRQFVRELMSVDEAVSKMQAASNGSTSDAFIYSDAGDNPGGGGSGTSTELLAAMIKADVADALYGCFFEPEFAKACHDSGVGSTVSMTFNAAAAPGTGKALKVEGRVVAVGDGDIVGRRGIFRNRKLVLGPVAAISVGASNQTIVVLISQRVQAADPVMFEMLGLEPGRARTVVVKSRGHFRSGFDEWFNASRVMEVDTAGYTSPVLSRFDWKGLPRPCFPVDHEVSWTVGE